MDEDITVEGLPYAFPKSHIEGVVSPTEGATYVALRPPGENIMLIIDERVDRKQERVGRKIISRINYSDHNKVEHLQGLEEDVYCDNALKFQCGFEIVDDGIKWSIRFNREDINDLSEISRKSASFIKGYRGAAHGDS